jgi:hypothetical protein
MALLSKNTGTACTLGWMHKGTYCGIMIRGRCTLEGGGGMREGRGRSMGRGGSFVRGSICIQGSGGRGKGRGWVF